MRNLIYASMHPKPLLLLLTAFLFVSINATAKDEFAPPSISYFTPYTGGQGETVTINGSDFTGVTSVSFGGQPALSFQVINNFQVQAIVGSGASGAVSITTSAGTGSLGGFIYDNTPQINSFNPMQAKGGDTVTIFGKNLLNCSSVKFGNTEATSFEVISLYIIKAVVAPGSASGNITVQTPFGTANQPGFYFIRKPVIYGFTPDSAYRNQQLNIYGENLGVPGAGSVVTLGGVNAGYSGYNGNYSSISVYVGNGSTGFVKVTTLGGTDSIAGFKFIPPPVINSFSPASAKPRDTVDIYGSGFLNTSAVYFGDSSARSFVIVSPGHIRAAVSHGKTGPVKIVQPSGISTLGGFTFIPLPPPVVESFTPVAAISGTELIVTGQYLWGVTSVKIGTTPVKFFTQVDFNTLKITVPLGASGTVNVVTYYGQHTSSSLFQRVLPAAITGISPLFAEAGQSLVIQGNGFGTDPAAVKVKIGDIPAAISAIGDNSITITIPAGVSYGYVNVMKNGLTVYSQQKFNPVNNSIAYLNITGGSFKAMPPIGSSGIGYDRQTAAIDLNGDGKIDFITISNYGTWVYKINESTPGKPVWRDAGSASLYSATRVSVADMDGDGKSDVVIFAAGWGGGDIGLNISTADTVGFVFSDKYISEDGRIADMNGDGKMDVVTKNGNYNSGPLYVLLNNSVPGKIMMSDTLILNMPSNFAYFDLMHVADLNGDSLPDIIGKNGNYTYVFKNTGTRELPSFTANPVALKIDDMPSSYFYNPEKAITGDMDGDGMPDLLVAHNAYNTASFNMYRNTSSGGDISFAPYQLITNSRVGKLFDLADFNGDNKPDIVIGDDMWTAVHQNRSTPGNIALEPKISTLGGTDAACVADIDGDNKQDIISSSYNNLFVLRNRMNEPQQTPACVNGNVTLNAGISGFAYQWQVDTGNGYTNITNNTNYSGVNTAQLTITAVPTGFFKYKYRCKVNYTINGEPYVIEFSNNWLGNTGNSNWHNPANWSCGVVPDGNTIVNIPIWSTITLGTNGSCRSINIGAYSNVTVAPGVILTITNN